MSEKDLKVKMNVRLNETFIVQLIFGVAMIIVPIVMMIMVYGFDFNLLFSIISGALLIVYSVRFYYVKINLLDQVEKSEKDFHIKARARLNETFIVQLIFGVAMIIVPIVMMIMVYGFNFNLLISIISGALLIVYSFRFYYVKTDLIDRIEKFTKSSE